MLANVTNRSPGPRGLLLVDNSTRTLDPGETVLVDLAEHPVHRGWEASGDIVIVAVADETIAEEAAPRGKASRRIQT